jgi:hypothetical protein
MFEGSDTPVKLAFKSAQSGAAEGQRAYRQFFTGCRSHFAGPLLTYVFSAKCWIQRKLPWQFEFG